MAKNNQKSSLRTHQGRAYNPVGLCVRSRYAQRRTRAYRIGHSGRSQLAHRQTAALPPAATLPLHLELRVHELGLHPGTLLLVVSHAGPIEEVGEVGDCFGCDYGGE